eukprot:6027718-Amphidinium_carterae.1
MSRASNGLCTLDKCLVKEVSGRPQRRGAQDARKRHRTDLVFDSVSQPSRKPIPPELLENTHEPHLVPTAMPQGSKLQHPSEWQSGTVMCRLRGNGDGWPAGKAMPMHTTGCRLWPLPLGRQALLTALHNHNIVTIR